MPVQAQTEAILKFNKEDQNKQVELAKESVIYKTDAPIQQINASPTEQSRRGIDGGNTNPRVKKQTSKKEQIRRDYPAEAVGEIQIVARTLVTEKWGEDEWPTFKAIINKESGWCPTKWNGQRICPEIPTARPSNSSGAYGLCQSLPATKMASAGSDYMTNPLLQVHWCINYISSRYRTPTKAMQFHQTHNWF